MVLTAEGPCTQQCITCWITGAPSYSERAILRHHNGDRQSLTTGRRPAVDLTPTTQPNIDQFRDQLPAGDEGAV